MSDLSWFIYYLLMLGLIMVILIFAHRLSNRYQKKYLDFLLYYLIFSTFYTFLIYVVPDLLVFARGESIFSRDTSTYWLCSFLALPLAIIHMYFFACFFLNLANSKVPFFMRYWYFFSGIILLLLYGYGLNVALHTGSSELFRYIYNFVIRMLFTILGFACILYAIIRSKTLLPIPRRRAVRFICGYYIVAFLIQIPLFFLPQSEVVFYGRPFYFIAMNLPALIYLGRFLPAYNQPELLAVNDSEKLRLLFEEYLISRREQEVFLLLFSGCSNKEIEKKLYISLRTVKSHVYNVYQKFGVNSRLKLVNLVRVKLLDSSQSLSE